jgi:hypothetical protein
MLPLFSIGIFNHIYRNKKQKASKKICVLQRHLRANKGGEAVGLSLEVMGY